MGVGDLINIFAEAKEKLRNIYVGYTGFPYTEDIVNALFTECNMALESYNPILRATLGIELYLSGGANMDDLCSVSGFLGVRRAVSIGIEVEMSEIS